jgi:hypothetical protein
MELREVLTFLGVKINRLHSFAAREQLSLDVQLHLGLLRCDGAVEAVDFWGRGRGRLSSRSIRSDLVVAFAVG